MAIQCHQVASSEGCGVDRPGVELLGRPCHMRRLTALLLVLRVVTPLRCDSLGVCELCANRVVPSGMV